MGNKNLEALSLFLCGGSLLLLFSTTSHTPISLTPLVFYVLPPSAAWIPGLNSPNSFNTTQVQHIPPLLLITLLKVEFKGICLAPLEPSRADLSSESGTESENTLTTERMLTHKCLPPLGHSLACFWGNLEKKCAQRGCGPSGRSQIQLSSPIAASPDPLLLHL